MLRMWTYDVAREQSPSRETLRELADLTLEAGYDALGLYLEHRFAYPSLPWAAGKGALQPDDVRWLIERYRGRLRIVPFLNLLGHCEGLIYTEEGARYAAERFAGMQADPTNAAFVALAEGIVDDALAIFEDEIVHLGGDETWQLGLGPGSAARVAGFAAEGTSDPKARLYAEHFAPLVRRVIEAGRRPALWGDMFFDHPDALASVPTETLIFDWQYFRRPEATARFFVDRGFEVVLSPTIHTYNAVWCHLPQTERNVRDHVEVAHALGAAGVCVTTWECGLFGNYETLLPAIRGCGAILNEPAAEPKERTLTSGFQIEERDELAGEAPAGEAANVFVQVANRLVESALPLGTLRVVRDGDAYSIRTESGDERGRFPFGGADYVFGRLRLLAGMSVQGRGLPGDGEIRGRTDAGPFRVAFRYEPGADDGTVTLRTVEGVASPDPETLKGQGGGAAVARYAAEREAPALLKAYLQEGENAETWARIMGIEMQEVGGLFAFSGIRSSLKCRLLLYSNPFLLWLRDRESFLGEPGDRAFEMADRAVAFAPDAAYRGVAELVKLTVEFVRQTEMARLAYADRRPGQALTHLSVCRQTFESLEKIAKAFHFRFGGSLADIERCRIARLHVETVMRRVKEHGDGSLGYLPSFETITHPKFVPHDQANWWLINRWANE